MKKILFSALLCLTATLTACSLEEPYGEVENAVVVEKENVKTCGYCNSYYVTLEKNGDKIKLKFEASNANVYDAIIEGSTINVSYDKDFHIKEIEFPLMQEEKAVDKDKE